MGCSMCKTDGSETEQFQKGGKKDLSNGPLEKRSCTDILCVGIFVFHMFVFLIITCIGFASGDPRKLYRPRDYKGGYCGLGPSFGEHEKLVYMQNTTQMVDDTMKQVVCSTAAKNELESILSTSDYQDYLCSCCLIPCEPCDGSFEIPDISSPSDMSSVVSGSMSRFTDTSAGASLMTSSSASYAAVDPEAIFSEMTKNFIPVCFQGSCSVPTGSSGSRTYTYSPDFDSPFKSAWDKLLSDTSVSTDIRNTIANDFTFTALPEDICPYPARYCIPMPGVNFTEAPNDYCFPQLESDVASALGAAASVLEGLGSSSIAESGAEGLGGLVGQIWNTLDALFLVVFWSFMIGLVFMVLLRFFVGCLVWTSLGLVFFFLFAGGGIAYIRSGQCAGASLFESGTQAAVAVTIAATSAAADALSGDSCDESLTGDGYDYRGCQTTTRSGLSCQAWSEQQPHTHSFTPASYPEASLTGSYCRNPANASTIWCYTTDVDKKWELCTPIGVITPACPEGYAIETEVARQALEICAYVVWGLAGIWILLVIFMYKRIKLAIAINKVAAMFVQHTPSVLMVPIIQIFFACLYSLLWALSASFLLSQVPDSYTSTESYATYEAAMGTADTAGGCNPAWPAGFAWKTGGDLTATDDPCSGNKGDTSDITPKCWECAAPRYVFDWYFGYSFFSYLWNNALFVAMGQCIIACAVGMWFFTQQDNKGKKSPTWRAIKVVLRYHIGSLAFGAFIIAVIQFIRYFMKYMEKQAQAQKNRIMVLVLKILQCCMWCFEKCMKFLNKNAYIQIALLGTNFCTSAKNAFFLILRNAARFSVMLILGSIISFIGSSVIIVGSTLSGYFILQLLYPSASPAMPVLIYFAMSYMVAKLFMNVFGLAVDTSLQCFIAAEEQKLDRDCIPSQLRSLLSGKGGSDKKVAPSTED
mmetsp:Transcript_125987/g.327174  ORF Transcript_125987/g.327174 Transcript_125987/m.327174 type:complete len:926 (+) Transcript_125987:139-2916(+)